MLGERLRWYRLRQLGDGGVDGATVIGIRDELVSGDVSGMQRGNAIVVSNAAPNPAKPFSLTGTTITEFQKTGAIFRNIDVTVDDNDIDGNGPHDVIGQNGIQLSSGSFGDVTNNDISGIGYTPATITPVGILVFDWRAASMSPATPSRGPGRKRHSSTLSTPRM